MTNAMEFEIIGYSYDPNSGDLRLVGYNEIFENCTIETIIHNPTPSMLERAATVYSNLELDGSIDISFFPANKSRTPISLKTTREELEKNINEYNKRFNTKKEF